MFSLIKESLRITNKYIILATPLILFSLISSLYLLFSTGGNLISLIIAVVLFFLMFTAFLSGWLFMVKKCVANPEGEEVNALITEFPSGVGEYFLNVLGMVFIIGIVFGILGGISSFAGIKIIGDMGISVQQLSSAMSSTEALKTFLTSLSEEQLLKLNAWNLLVLLTMLFGYMILLFYFPAMFYKEKNPLKSFFINIKDFFSRKFIKNVILFLILTVIYFILSILTAFAASNIFANFVFTLVNFYYIVFAVVHVFNYYYSNFIKVGSNIDTTV